MADSLDIRVAARPEVTPASGIEALASRAWYDLLGSAQEKARIANWLSETVGVAWCAFWEGDCLIVERQFITADKPGNARPQRVTCNGKSITAEGEPTDVGLQDEFADVMAKIAKALYWPKVTLRGSAHFQARFHWYALHETDIYTWAIATARSLRERRPVFIDWEGVAEELEDLAISQKRAVESHLRVLLAHLLKWAYEPGHQSKSWRLSIENARDSVQELLQENPGLRQQISSRYISAYRKARRDASSETALEVDTLPPVPPWPYEQAMDDNFWPSAGGSTSG